MNFIEDENKYKSFLNKIENENKFTKELNNLFNIMFKDCFKNILNIPKIDFLSKLSKDVTSILIEHYTTKILENENLENFFISVSDKYEKKYDEYYADLSFQWKKYLYQKSRLRKSDNEEKKLENFYFKNFVKHCSKTGEFALHNCKKKNKLSKFISVLKIEKDNNDKSETKYLICENCRKVFFIRTFNNYCEYCKVKYYSTILNNKNKENEFLFLATVYPTHCNLLFNKIILCQKCNKQLYINIKTNQLICVNKKCKFVELNGDNLEWKCNKCETNYMTRAIVYNETEVVHYEDMIEKALILKRLAHPNKTCCISNENISTTEFYHSKKCRGILYSIMQNKTLFLVCEKCRAINFFKNFIWKCPFCGLNYREIYSDENKEKLVLKNKKYRNNNSRKNLFEYITKKKASYNSIYESKNFKSDLNENKDIMSKFNQNRMRNNNLVNYKSIANSVEKLYNHKLKNISTELSSSYLETNNELSNQRAGSQNKRAGLFKKILHGFIKPEEKTWNSVEKRNFFNIKEAMPSYDNSNINRPYYSKFNININLKKNFDYCLSNGRQLYNDVENDNHNNELMFDNELYQNEKVSLLNKTQHNKNLNNLISSDDKRNQRSNIMNLKLYNRNSNSNIISNKTSNEKEKKNGKTFFDKNKILYKKYIMPKNNNVLSKTKESIFHINSKENNSTENDNQIINHSVSSNIDFTNFQKYKKEKTNNEMLNITKKRSDDIHNLNKNNFSSISKYRYNGYILDEKYKKMENKNKNFILRRNANNINKADKKENDNKKMNKDMDVKNEIVKDYKDTSNNREKYKNLEKNEIPKKGKKLNWRIKQFFVNKDSNVNNDMKSNEAKIDKTEENMKEEKYKYKRIKEGIKRNNRREKIYADKGDFEEVTLSEGIKIEDEKIKINKILYDNIKMRLINLVARSKLPLFNIDNYLIWQKIGSGSNGEIFEISSNTTNKNYAVKIIKEDNITSLEYIIKEFELIYQNKHKNIITVYGICLRCSHKNMYILYVLMDLGLYDWEEEISKRKNELKYYTEKELVSILKQLISALLFLQKEKNISHRDIKLENVLVFKNNIFKLCDFGEAKQKVERNMRKTLRGTDFYMSPLLYNGLIHNENYVQHNPYKSDVFSLGFSMIIAASLSYDIIKDIRKLNQQDKIKEILVNNFKNRYSDYFIYVIMKMITIDEKNRPDFIELSRIVNNYYLNTN